MKYASDPKDIAERTHPTIQVDLFYRTAGNCLLLCMAKLIRSNNGVRTILQPGKFYEKSRTALAERCIQTVRAQGKTLISHLQDRARVALDELHVLQS